MNRAGASALALLLAIAGALALRLPHLDTRPLHNDEAVNAVKLAALLEHGQYAYDPDEYHGPALHYFSLPFLWLSGARTSDQLDDTTLRLAPVAFGVGLILLLLLFVDGLGPTAIVWAAVFTAISPAMVFYSRYFIHEMLLVFFTALTMGAGWRWFQTRLARWAVVAGVGVGLMWATKETFVLALAAMGIALAWEFTLQRVRAGEQAKAWTPTLRHIAVALLAALTVWLVLFSSLFTNWNGLADSVRTYLPWLKRAGGHSPHIHPWSFYLERLAWFHPGKSPVWSEGLILALAAVGAGVSLFGKKSPLHRFLAIYTITLTIIYSAIAYKTPWCALGFLHGMILLAGVGAAALWEFCRARVLKVFLALALGVLAFQLASQARRAGFDFASDRRNPWVYAQTVPDIFKLTEKVEGLASVAPAGHATVVKVIAPDSDYWPLPWYLRRFEHTGWYDKLPDDAFAPVIIVSSKLNARLDEKSDKKWVMAGMFELRPGKFLELYVELELWRKFVETLPREVESPP
ncbi:MAG: TIGR03663 family protein [Pedosphaera sp.]|nr:TIGR03663 family protein [Pedosphaera sp.]